MRYVFVLLFISILSLFAKNFQSVNIGYTIETAKLNHPKISECDTLYSYAYKINGIHLKQNHLYTFDIKYYPSQNFAKGFENELRYKSTINKLDAKIMVGFKKYIVRFFYFVPTVGIRYNHYLLKYSIDAGETKGSNKKEFFAIPLNIGLGYSIDPRSDIILFYNLDEDLTNLNSHDYKSLSLNLYKNFKNNVSLFMQIGKIEETDEDDFRQTKAFISLSLGLMF